MFIFRCLALASSFWFMTVSWATDCLYGIFDVIFVHGAGSYGTNADMAGGLLNIIYHDAWLWKSSRGYFIGTGRNNVRFVLISTSFLSFPHFSSDIFFCSLLLFLLYYIIFIQLFALKTLSNSISSTLLVVTIWWFRKSMEFMELICSSWFSFIQKKKKSRNTSSCHFARNIYVRSKHTDIHLSKQ